MTNSHWHNMTGPPVPANSVRNAPRNAPAVLRAATVSLLAALVTVAAEVPSDPLAALNAVAANSKTVDLGKTALLIANALNATVNVDMYESKLDTLAGELGSALGSAPDTKAKLETMAHVIYGRWRFADKRALPAEVFVSFADVLDQKQWNCFAMSVLYVALGERTGIPLEIVSGRGHALVHCAGTPYFVETTDGGRVHDGIGYLANYLPFACLNPKDYKPVSAREAVAVLLTQTGQAQLAQGDTVLAGLCYRHALSFDADNAETHAALGFLAVRRREPDRAIEFFQTAIASDPTLREAYGGLGVALHAKGDLPGAADAFRKAVVLCGTQPEPVFNLAQVLYESGDLESSIAIFKKYIALSPNDPDGYFHLAFPLEDAGKLDEALVAYRNVLRISPRNADALVNSGGILEKQLKWGDAESAYVQAQKIAPGNALACAGLGRVYTATDRFQAAAKVFDQSVTLDGTNASTWIDYARLDRKRGDTSAAIEKLNRAVAIDPAGLEAHMELAQVYLDRGDADNAAKQAQIIKGSGAPLPVSVTNLLKRVERK